MTLIGHTTEVPYWERFRLEPFKMELQDLRLEASAIQLRQRFVVWAETVYKTGRDFFFLYARNDPEVTCAAVQKQWESVTAKGHIFSVAEHTKAKCPSRATADITPLLSGSVWARDLYDYSSFLPQSPTITPSPAVNTGIARRREGEWHYTAGKALAVGSFETCNRIRKISPFVRSAEKLMEFKIRPFSRWGDCIRKWTGVTRDRRGWGKHPPYRFFEVPRRFIKLVDADMENGANEHVKKRHLPPDGSWPLFNEKEMPIKTTRQTPAVHGERNSSL